MQNEKNIHPFAVLFLLEIYGELAKIQKITKKCPDCDTTVNFQL